VTREHSTERQSDRTIAHQSDLGNATFAQWSLGKQDSVIEFSVWPARETNDCPS
jgi:hypothetical protein